MKFSKSKIESERVRLPERGHCIAKSTGRSFMGRFFFGFIFVVVGTFFILYNLGIFPGDPLKINGPNWLVAFFGGMFLTGGMVVWIVLFKEYKEVKRRKAITAQYSQTEILKDYPWNPRGTTKSPWQPARRSFFTTLLFFIFLIPFNWLVWGTMDSGMMFKIIVSIFDIILILTTFEMVKQILAALKYGSSRVEYKTFPFLTGNRITLNWLPPSGLGNTSQITFILRCVEEWRESQGRGDSQTIAIIHEQLWAVTKKTVDQLFCQHNRPIILSFEIPEEVPGSNLSDERKITFWELDVCAETSGIDFQECYLVPIY